MIEVIDNIVLAPIPNAGYSTIGFFVMAGSMYEDEMRSGTAHLLEHTLIAGEEAGESIEGWTQLEQMIFQSRQLPHKTTNCLHSLYDAVYKQPLKESDFIMQQERVRIELETAYQHNFYKEAYGILFGKHSGQHKGWSGYSEDIKLVTFEDITDYKGRYLTPDRTVVVVSGEFIKEDVMTILSELHLQHIHKPPVPLPNGESKNILVYNTRIDEKVANVDIFIPTAPLSNFKYRFINNILGHCLTGESFSLLDTLLYKEIGFVYSVERNSFYWTNGGVSIISYNCPSNKGEMVTDKVNHLLCNLPQLLTKDIFEKAVESSLIQHRKISRNPEELIQWIGEDFLLTGEVIGMHEQEKIIKKCTYEEVQNQAKVVAKLASQPHVNRG